LGGRENERYTTVTAGESARARCAAPANFERLTPHAAARYNREREREREMQ